MTNQIKVIVDSEQVGDLVVSLLDVEDIEAEIEREYVAPPDEKKEHPFYSLFPSDLATILITIPATITSLTGLAKVILDYKLKASKNKANSKQARDILVIVIDEEIIHWSNLSSVEELAELLEQKTKKAKTQSGQVKVLFLAANPKDSSQLRLDEEMRSIDQALRQAEFRDKFDIKQHWAVRVADLQGYLLRHRPDIVHFSGHGSTSSEIILEDNNGNSQAVTSRALSHLFSVLKDNIRCVVLNACYSEQQAQAIAESIDCVIGMSHAIGDQAAINFAAAFYQALGYGRDVKTAFDLGCLQIDLEGLDEQDTPKLLAVNSPPESVTFI